ncbi:hypothetical protein C0Q70_00480 [Pomacea canaliculata]|uniref:Uncharacterized protein n=1 Tax=Pomacea canaliculata TaxID=400727 RepID=A0A2T7PWU7_POMCA|nr:hypothetical protein C0Q70_00480 [Pomacea canaliculata]
MSGQTNSLTSPPQETSSSHTKTLETRKGADTPPRTQTEGCDDEDDCGSSNNYNNNVLNDVNTDVHKDYIEKNRNILENKCKKFYTCTKELYKTETLSRILEGGDIQLHNICGVLIQDKDDQHATETNTCWPQAREFLQQELEEELKTKMEKYYDDNDDEPTWEDLADCLNNTADLDKLCRAESSANCINIYWRLTPTVSGPERADWLDLWWSASGDDAPRRNRCPPHQETQTQESSVRTMMLFSVLMLMMSLMSSRRTVMSFSVCRLCVVLVSLPLTQAVQTLKYPHQSEAQRSANVTSSADDTLSTYEIVDDHFQGPNSWSERIKSWHSRDQATSGLPPRDLSYQPPHTTSSGDHHSEDSAPDIVFLSPRQGLPAPHL